MINIKRYDTPDLKKNEEEIANTLRNSKIPNSELLKNLGLFINPGALGRILFANFLYEKIISYQGIIAEFGSRYGQNLNLFSSLRGIYEPYNRLRKIVGFDTFQGFVDVDKKDQNNKLGDYSVPENYYSELENILTKQEKFSPLSHLKKFELIKGDVSQTLPKYLKKNPHTIFAICYFDLDVYIPTKNVLSIIKNRLSKGTILVFDELNDEDMPGETEAFLEEINVNSISIRRFNPSARTSYCIWGE